MLKVSDHYIPLYTTKKPIIFITGGRGSAKSFNVATFTKRLTYEKNQVILYARYTMNSAKDSIIPEFQEKIDLEGDNKFFHVTKTDIINKRTASRIMFRGIKTSSGNQTAKLKSIQGLSTFIMDEAEEWQNESEYDTLSLSIRTKSADNRTIIIMNSSNVNHFLFKKYLLDTHKIVMFGRAPVHISTHPDVCHIHTIYKDFKEHLSDKFLKEVADLEENHPEKYATTIMGKWNDGNLEDSLFDYDSIRDIFSNYVEPSSRYRIVCDAAKYGRDFCVTMVFRGWEVIHVSVLKKSDVHDIIEDIERLRAKFAVQRSYVLVDGDGVGADAVKMGKYKSFHGGAKPIQRTSVIANYKNLKTQCAFHLAENVINVGKLLMTINNQTVTVDGSSTTKIKMGARVVDVRDLIIEDLQAIRHVDIDGERKKSINTKEEQKELLNGRSPDFFDVLNMMASTDFEPRSQYL